MRTARTALALTASLVASTYAARAAANERSVRVAPGVEIHLIDAGPSDRGPALVLIPGWLTTANVWNRQIAAFADQRRVIAIDPRGQGGSTKTAEGATPEQRARDLDAVLKTLGLGPVVLVGWSQGVQDVAAYVQAFGVGSIRGVVFVDAPVSAGAASVVRNPQAASDQLRMLGLYAQSPREYAEGMMRAIIRRPLARAELDPLVSAALQTPTAIGTAMIVADLFGADRTPALQKLDRPALVIASATSRELDAMKAMTASLPQGRMEVLEGAGHAVFIDQPERFDAALREFLEGVAPLATTGAAP